MGKQKTQVIAVSSGKGGVGKTTLSVNLGISLARQGLRVCLFDADTNLANINIMLRETPAYTLQHVLDGQKTISDIIVSSHGLSLVPGASGVTDFAALSTDGQKYLLLALKQLERLFDVILVDTSAGIHDDVLSFIESAHQSAIVITPEPTSLTDSFSLLRMLRKRKYRKRINIVVNQASSELGARQVFKRFSGAVAKYIGYKPAYLGYVISDDIVSSAVCSQVPVRVYRPSAESSRCYDHLAENLRLLLKNQPSELGLSDSLSHFIQPQAQEELADSISSPVQTAPEVDEVTPATSAQPALDGEQQQEYRQADRIRKKQLLEEHKQAVTEYIEDASYSKQEITDTLVLMLEAYFRRFKDFPQDPVEQLNRGLQTNTISQSRIKQLFSELMLFYKDKRMQLDRDSTAEFLNHQINDYVEEYGQYPFDTTQTLMQSVGMGHVSDAAVRELETVLNLVNHAGSNRLENETSSVYATDIEDDRKELVENLEKQINKEAARPLSTSRKGLIDSINFASKLNKF